MNTFGRLFKLSIFGESHGTEIGITLDGVPSGLALNAEDFEADLSRRRPGAVGTTSRTEADVPKIISGCFNGFTTGAPLTLLFENNNTVSKDYESLRKTPRPGHADFVASKKFRGFEDYRGGGHFSGRLTVLLVAAGVVAKKIIAPMSVGATLIEVGGLQDVELGLRRAVEQQDSVGGIVEGIVDNIPVGLGEPFFDSVESVLAHAIFSIPAIKGVEFGAGFAAAKLFGSQHNDSIIAADGTTETNHAGGVVGGISNGNPLKFKVAVKPTSSTPALQHSFNLETQQVEPMMVKGRHDLCIALRVPVVVEAVTAVVLADLFLVSKSSGC